MRNPDDDHASQREEQEGEARHRDIVVVGASAGGVQALSAFAAGLPADLAASVFVVMHLLAGGRSMLPEILARAGALPAGAAADGEPIVQGHIYVAPADQHVLVCPGAIRLGREPRERGHRPGIDRLFSSAAESYGPRVIGIVLSGLLHDGAEGMRAVRLGGGLTMVQDPEEALFDAMPRAAMAACEVDRVAPVRLMGAVLAEWTTMPLPAYGSPERN